MAYRNALFTALAAPGFTLILLGLTVLLTILSIVLVIPLFFGIPGLIALLGTRAVFNRLEAFGLREPEQDDLF
jgi:hypothetical protein